MLDFALPGLINLFPFIVNATERMGCDERYRVGRWWGYARVPRLARSIFLR